MEWTWFAVGFVLGGCFGVLLTGLIAAGRDDDEQDRR